jgi:hypothetical protein
VDLETTNCVACGNWGNNQAKFEKLDNPVLLESKSKKDEKLGHPTIGVFHQSTSGVFHQIVRVLRFLWNWGHPTTYSRTAVDGSPPRISTCAAVSMPQGFWDPTESCGFPDFTMRFLGDASRKKLRIPGSFPDFGGLKFWSNFRALRLSFGKSEVDHSS